MQTKTKFKKTPIGEIPEEWKVVRIRDVAEVVSGFTFPLGYQGKNSGKYPFIKVADLNRSSKYITTAENYIDEEDVKALRVKIYPPNTIIFPKIGMAVYLNKFRILKTWATFDNNVAGIIPKKHDPEFLHYYFLGRVNLKQLSNATTAPSIKKSTLAKLLVPLPPLPEQKKIAEILRTVDEAIEKTDLAIEKTERLKKGLMQRLLTRGIKHERFKKTELGEIPEEWILSPAEKICTRVTDGTHDTPKPTERGYYLITSRHLKDNEINFSEAYLISDEDFNEVNKRSKVDKGDVLFSMIGTVGVTAVVKPEYPDFAIKNVGLFKTSGNFDLAYWLYYYFQSPLSKRYIKNNLKGSTQKYITLKALRKFPIPLPPLSEQQKIAEILMTVDKKLELLRKRKEKLEKIKKGLMKDLLTGRRRACITTKRHK